MKKFLALLLILVLVGPVVGWACDCCPSEGAGPSKFPTLTSRHGCCPGLGVNPTGCGVGEIRQSLSVSPKTLRFQVASPSENFDRGAFAPASRPHSESPGPPFFASETPLYLALGILRI